MKNSPYLDRPLFPLGVALPQMLEKVAVELTTAEPAEKARLHRESRSAARMAYAQINKAT